LFSPGPDEANFVHWKVTDLQVAVAVPVWACALAVKIPSKRTASTRMLRTRGTVTAPRVATGVELWVIMLELLRAGVLSLLPAAEDSVTPRHGDERKEEVRAAGSSPKTWRGAIGLLMRTSDARPLVGHPSLRPRSWSRNKAHPPRFRASALVNILIGANVFQ
jgi:hypothetical protein